MRQSLIDTGSMCLMLPLLLLCMCQRASSDGHFILQLDKFRNPNSMLIEGEPCDTVGGSSPCDMRFSVSYKIGAAENAGYCVTPEYSDTTEVSNFCPTTITTSFSGAFPIAIDNWNVRVEVWDVDLTPDQKVDDFSINEFFDPPSSSIRSTSFNGAVPAEYSTITTKLNYEKTLTWSYKIYCSAYYYSGLCDKYCKPADNSIEGHYTCSANGDKECLNGYWDPATDCRNTYCSGTPLCQNNGTCNALVAGYTCGCTDDYTGRHCELPKDPCKAYAPCRNGTCSSPRDTTYSCTCNPGYSGRNCDLDTDECAGGPSGCNPAGTANCTNWIGSFKCDCKEGWSGTYCRNISDYCLAMRPCLHGNCSNGNSSIAGSSSSNYSCSCESGWTGLSCDQDVDECAAPSAGGFGSCLANGTATCVNLNGSFACNCRQGWAGPLCSNITDYCLAMKPDCHHGNCSNGNSSSYTCTCNTGWEGPACDADIDECSRSGYCVNGLSCVNTNGSYVCTCQPGFEGPRCDIRINPCAHERPCANGNCTPVATSAGPTSGYRCTCNTGWEGVACDTDIDECTRSGYCVNRLSCVNKNGSYVCTCQPGFEGPRCDIRTNPCTNERPCANGNCTPVTTSAGPTSDYSCACNTGWEGKNCTADRNECRASSNPCSFGQACVNLPGAYRCDITAASYWWVFLIIVLVLLLAAAAIAGWRILVCRQQKKLRQFHSNASSAPTVSVRPPKIRWPVDDRATLDDWKSDKYTYGNGDTSPRLPPRNPNHQALPMPALGTDAEYEVVGAVQSAATGGQENQLDDTGPYDDLRVSRMLGTGEEPEPLNETGPKPPVPSTARPTQKPALQSPVSSSVDSKFESVYDNSGYLTSQPPSRPVSNRGYLDMTNDPNGYVRPISVAHDQQLAAPVSPQLPPKPQKVKRKKPKQAPPPPTPTPTCANPTYATPQTAAATAAVDVPDIHLIDADGVDAGPITSSIGRLNSSDASEKL